MNYEKQALEELLDEIDSLEGHEFEYFCAELLRKCRYINVSVTPGSNDQGADITAEKDSIKYAFQCKRVNSHLNNKCVQEISVGRAFYKCDIGIVLTNNYFNENAKMAASATGVLLWDRQKLISMLNDSGILMTKTIALRERAEQERKAAEEIRKREEERQIAEKRKKAEEQRKVIEERRKAEAKVRKELYKKEMENEKDLFTSFSHSIGQKHDEILVIENTSQKENIFYNDINLVNSAGNTSNELQQRNNRTDKGFKLNSVKNVARKLICGYGILFFTMGIIAYFIMFVQSVIEGEFILSISALMLALDFIILDKIMFVQFKHEETVSHKNETMSRKKYTKTMLKTILKLTGFFIVIAVAGGLILQMFN